MSTAERIAAWFRANNPGGFRAYIAPDDYGPAGRAVERLAEDPAFWVPDTVAEPGVHMPHEQHWRAMEDAGFHDPDLLHAWIEDDAVVFEID